MKIVTIIEDDSITGVKYGTVEMQEQKPLHKISRVARARMRIQKIQEARAALQRMERTKNK